MEPLYQSSNYDNKLSGTVDLGVPPYHQGLFETFGSVETFKEGFLREAGPVNAFQYLMDQTSDAPTSFLGKLEAIRKESLNNLPPEAFYDNWGDPQLKHLPNNLMQFFADSRSQAESARILKLLQGQMERVERLQSGGFLGTLGMLAGVVVSELPLLTGSWAKLALRTPAVIGTNELILHSQHPLRTSAESILNIGIGTSIPVGATALGRLFNEIKPIDVHQAADLANDITAQSHLTRTGREPEYPDDVVPAEDPNYPISLLDDTPVGLLSDDDLSSLVDVSGTLIEERKKGGQPFEEFIQQHNAARAEQNRRASVEPPTTPPVAASRLEAEDDFPQDPGSWGDDSGAPFDGGTRDVNEVLAKTESVRTARNAVKNELVNPDDIRDIDRHIAKYLENKQLVQSESDHSIDAGNFESHVNIWTWDLKVKDPVRFNQALDNLVAAASDVPIAKRHDLETVLINAKPAENVDDVVNLVDGFVKNNAITVEQAASIKAVLRTMPDNIFRDARIGADPFSPRELPLTTAGIMAWTSDVIEVFGLPTAKFTRHKPYATAGHIFAHEVSHRIMYTMMDEAQLLEARNLFMTMAKKDVIPDQTKGFIKGYDSKEHFSEWFADEMAGYWVRLSKQGKTAADDSLERTHGSKWNTLSQIFNDILDRLIAFVLRLKGDKDFSRTLTYNEMLDNYFSKLVKNITDQDADALRKMIASKLKQNREIDDPVVDPQRRDRLLEGALPFNPNLFSAYGSPPPKKPVLDNFDPAEDDRLISAAFLEKLPDSPVKRLLMSGNAFARHVASYLVEHPFYQNKNANSPNGLTAHGVDRNVSINWIAPMVDALKATDEGYFKYRQRFFNERGGAAGVPAHEGSIAQGFYDFIGDRAGALSRGEFYEEVAKAKRRLSDPDPQGLPEAYETARYWHENLYKPALKAARDEKMFSLNIRREIAKKREMVEKLEATRGGMTRNQLKLHAKIGREIKKLEDEAKVADNISDNDNYLNRLWNIAAIKNDPLKLERILMERGGYTRAEAKGKIKQIVEGEHFRELEPGETGMARSLKKREIEVDDIYLEEFLENNIGALGRYYASRMGADIELTRQFGSIDMAEIMAELRKYSGDSKQLAADERDLLAIRDRIRGTYGIPENPDTWTHRGIRIAKMFNATTLLTGALAAVPDMAKLVMTDGFANTMRMSLEAFRSDLSLLKLAKRDANLAGEALDMYLAMRSALFADLADSLSAATPFERRAGQVTQQFFNVSLMNQWNEFAKTMASLFTGSRIIQNAEKLARGTKLSKTELIKMKNVGIGPEESKIIVEQFNKHGLKGKDVRIAKTDLWDATPEVERVKQIYLGALGKDINRTIVTPGKGDAPLIMSKPLATLILQFKTFAIASTHRTLVPGMQLRDRNFLVGAIGLVGLGIMVDQIRRWQNEDTREQSFNSWLGSGIERSGILGYFTDINRAIEVLSDGRLGLTAMFNENTMPSNTLDKLGVMGGPLVHQVGKAADILWDVSSGDVDRGTVGNARDLMIFGNVFHADGLFGVAEEGLVEAFE